MDGLQVIPFVSGVRLLTPIDTENNVITDVTTETDRAEFMFLGKEDNPENYKAIDRHSSLHKLTASDGMVFTDIATETMRAKTVYLCKEDSEENYKEIDENTPLPEPTESEV